MATSLKIAVSDLFGRDAPFALLGFAIVAAGTIGGPRSAFFASALSSIAGWYYFLAPFDSFALSDAAMVGRLVALSCEGLIISGIIAGLDAAKKGALKSAARLERVQSLTSELAVAITPSEVAEVTVRKAVEALGASAGVFVQPNASGELELIAHVGIAPDIAIALRSFPPDSLYPSAIAFARGAPEWIEDATEYARRYPDMSRRLGDGFGAAASLPLRVGERKLGALAFRFDRARRFDRAERELMATMASQAAQSFERAQMFAEEVRSRHRLEKLHELMDALSVALTQAEVAEIVVECGMRIAGADTCTLYVPDVDGSLRLIGDRGVSASVLDRVRHIGRDSGNPSLTTIRTGETLWAETEADYLAIYPALATMKSDDGPRAHAFWSVPLIAEGIPIGLLGMGFYAETRFPPEERAFVGMLTRHCGQALRRAERLEAERHARSVAERLQSSFETTLRSIGDAVIATDARGRVSLMNHVAEDLTGWRESDAKERPLREVFHIVNEQTRAEVQSPVELVLRDGLVVGLANHTLLVHRDGKRETPIDDSGAPIRGAAGALDGVVLVFRDVSVKKRAERRALILSEASAALSE
ncbi:MAG TPA: GAF domain-containing protein, partial [Polyangiales bacterium]